MNEKPLRKPGLIFWIIWYIDIAAKNYFDYFSGIAFGPRSAALDVFDKSSAFSSTVRHAVPCFHR
jgi:hypothetical protein